jgi:hypothetical protein
MGPYLPHGPFCLHLYVRFCARELEERFSGMVCNLLARGIAKANDFMPVRRVRLGDFW